MTWTPFIVLDQNSKTRLEFLTAKETAVHCLGRYTSGLIIIVNGKEIFDPYDHPEQYENHKRLEKELKQLLTSL